MTAGINGQVKGRRISTAGAETVGSASSVMRAGESAEKRKLVNICKCREIETRGE